MTQTSFERYVEETQHPLCRGELPDPAPAEAFRDTYDAIISAIGKKLETLRELGVEYTNIEEHRGRPVQTTAAETREFVNRTSALSSVINTERPQYPDSIRCTAEAALEYLEETPDSLPIAIRASFLSLATNKEEINPLRLESQIRIGQIGRLAKEPELVLRLSDRLEPRSFDEYRTRTLFDQQTGSGLKILRGAYEHAQRVNSTLQQQLDAHPNYKRCAIEL